MMKPKEALAKKKAEKHEKGEKPYVEAEETRMENKGWSEKRSERRAHGLRKMR
jgi:hypothetical protein